MLKLVKMKIWYKGFQKVSIGNVICVLLIFGEYSSGEELLGLGDEIRQKPSKRLKASGPVQVVVHVHGATARLTGGGLEVNRHEWRWKVQMGLSTGHVGDRVSGLWKGLNGRKFIVDFRSRHEAVDSLVVAVDRPAG